MKKFFYINFGAINSWGIDRMTQKLFFYIFGFCPNLHKTHEKALRAKMPRNAVIWAIF